MKAGNLKILITLLFLIFNKELFSNEKLTLENLEPTFEEDAELNDNEIQNKNLELKSKNIKKSISKVTVVNLKALDKITAKTSDINIPLGKKKKFGYLEILPKKCSFSKSENENGVVAYLQVKDLSVKKDDKIFIFNGWTFSSSTTLKTFDHPVYDLWVTGCENI